MSNPWKPPPQVEAVIGLEIHVQLRTQSKLFCRCRTAYGAPPNTQVCPVCLGRPGVLPVVNREAVNLALRFGVSVGAEIHRRSRFARKNYFYPDLPKGYQITQYEHPLLTGGMIPFSWRGERKSVRLSRAHLEEDAGKSIHRDEGGKKVTRVDFNRCGVPLLEIVTEPDVRSPTQARVFLERLRLLAVTLGISEGNMEEGNLRCDANVSVRRPGDASMGAKVEVKNLNSFRFVERALTWEIDRQARRRERGEAIRAESRSWDEEGNRTRLMRVKEDTGDYRYFPEPDLPPVVVDESWVARVRESMPELPEDRQERLCRQYGVTRQDARVLASDPALAAYFEETATVAGNGPASAHWVLTEILRLAKRSKRGLTQVKVKPVDLGRLVRSIAEGTVTATLGKRILAEMAHTGRGMDAVRNAADFRLQKNPQVLAELARGILASHPAETAQYLAGKEAVARFFLGKLMEKTNGRAFPPAAAGAIRKALETLRETQAPPRADSTESEGKGK